MDAIANSYIPLLFVLFLAGLERDVYLLWPNYRASLISLFYLIGLLAAAYGLMFIDNTLRLWPTFGLDYSTHTAVSLALVLGLAKVFPARWTLLAVSFVGYLALMLYQQYHSLLDVLTTSVVIGTCATLLSKALIFIEKPTRQSAQA